MAAIGSDEVHHHEQHASHVAADAVRAQAAEKERKTSHDGLTSMTSTDT